MCILFGQGNCPVLLCWSVGEPMESHLWWQQRI